MAETNPYQILGIEKGASDKEIKTAYRNLAKKYHPDKNDSPQATKMFRKITAAYDELLEGPPPKPYRRDPSYYDANLRKEKNRARERYKSTNWAKAKEYEAAEKKKREEAERKFRESNWFDLFLLLKYIFKGLVILFTFTAIIGPVLLGIFVEPVAMLATIYFLIIGIFLAFYIWERKSKWFKLGPFKTKTADIYAFFKKPTPKETKSKCYYCKNHKADGKPFLINLIKIIDIRIRTFGAMNHQSKIKQTSHMLTIPRSAKAQLVHRIVSVIRILNVVLSIIFFPVDSIFFRIFAGFILAGVTSVFILLISRTKSKTSFIITPAFLIKMGVWLLVFALLSEFGPGFNVRSSEYLYLSVAGLFLILDMVFDLVFGFFPFYNKLFYPIIRQGTKLTKLYKDGFQNYMEYPINSVVAPIYKWLF